MADARPVTDDWVERDIMVFWSVAFWRAVIAIWAIGFASGLARAGFLGHAANWLMNVARRVRERVLGALTWLTRLTGYLPSMGPAPSDVK
jgi:hypothetical protein